jgi:CRP-like cAMP-binding protein
MLDTKPDVIAGALGACPLFADFPAQLLLTLASYFDVMEGRRGDALFAQRDAGDGLYVVVEGRLQSYVSDERGDEHAVATLVAPASFGELALLLRGTRMVTVRALGDVTLLELSHESFRRLKLRNPDLCLMVVMAIVRQLGFAMDNARDILQRVLIEQARARNGTGD